MLAQTTKSAGSLTININNLMISYLIQEFLSLLIGQTRFCRFTEAVWPLKCSQKDQTFITDLCSNTFFSPSEPDTMRLMSFILPGPIPECRALSLLLSFPVQAGEGWWCWGLVGCHCGAGVINGRGIKSEACHFLHACTHKKLFPWR